MTTITGRTTDTAVHLTAVDDGGTVLAKGKTKSLGYRYLVVRYRPAVAATYLNAEHPAKVTVEKRTGDLKVARRAAERSLGVVLVADRDGNYTRR